jgi:hypothetical protein
MTVWEVLLRRHTDRDTSAMTVLIFRLPATLPRQDNSRSNLWLPGQHPYTNFSTYREQLVSSVSIASISVQLTLAITSYINSIIRITQRALGDNDKINVLPKQPHHTFRILLESSMHRVTTCILRQQMSS